MLTGISKEVFRVRFSLPQIVKQYPLASSALALLIVFLIINYQLVRGTASAHWDALNYFGPYFMLIADHARAGKFVLWDPWTSGGTPVFAEPELGAYSPLMVFVGAIFGGNEAGFRVYWLLIWFLGPFGLLILGRHLGVGVHAYFDELCLFRRCLYDFGISRDSRNATISLALVVIDNSLFFYRLRSGKGTPSSRMALRLATSHAIFSQSSVVPCICHVLSSLTRASRD